tara:strand:+ start:64 stop:492 length:429 start_codon:yes stop_codon:yes gene_type:complete
MKKEKLENCLYHTVNTPVVTHMLNVMQWVYNDPHVRSATDEVVDNDGTKEQVSPLFSAFQAFILSSSIMMKKPGGPKGLVNLTHREILENVDKTIFLLESFLLQPVRTSLVAGLDKFVTNGKFEAVAIKDEHVEKMFERKIN